VTYDRHEAANGCRAGSTDAPAFALTICGRSFPSIEAALRDGDKKVRTIALAIARAGQG
jgi:hypothetical protein